MTLAFRTQLNGKPTYFVEKIWKSLKDLEITKELVDATFVHNFSWERFGCMKPKLHTIREDKSNRWKACNYIHFVINNRTPQRFQFAPVVKCVSVQNIEIRYFIKNNVNKVSIKVDGVKTSLNDISINDGFESPGEFLDYFNKDFTGKIIHWTNLKY